MLNTDMHILKPMANTHLYLTTHVTDACLFVLYTHIFVITIWTYVYIYMYRERNREVEREEERETNRVQTTRDLVLEFILQKQGDCVWYSYLAWSSFAKYCTCLPIDYPLMHMICCESAEGPRGEGPRRGGETGIGTPSTDYTKPQQTIQSPDRLYKAPKDYTKPQKDYKKPQKSRHRHKILNKSSNKYESNI